MSILKWIIIGAGLLTMLLSAANAQTVTFAWDYDVPDLQNYQFGVRLIRMRIDTCTCKDAVYNVTIKDYWVTGRLTANVIDICTRFYDPNVRYAVIAKVKAKRINDSVGSDWSEPIILDLWREYGQSCDMTAPLKIYKLSSPPPKH